MFDKSHFFEKLYFHELDRKHSIESSLSLVTGIIAGLFGLVGYLFTHFRFGSSEYSFNFVVELIFLFSSAASFLLLVAAAWWCSRAVVGSAYEHLPGAETMTGYLAELLQWHHTIDSEKPLELATSDFEEFLITSYAKCSQINWKTNLLRAEELFRTKRATVWALFSLAAAALSYYINFWNTPPSIVP